MVLFIQWHPGLGKDPVRINVGSIMQALRLWQENVTKKGNVLDAKIIDAQGHLVHRIV